MVTVLDFDALWTTDLAGGVIYPTQCRTAPYVAGANEVAIATFAVFVTPSAATSQYVYLAVATSQNGAPFAPVSTYWEVDGTSDNAAHVSTTKRIPLVQGASYVFGEMIRSDNAISVFTSACHGTVLIARQ